MEDISGGCWVIDLRPSSGDHHSSVEFQSPLHATGHDDADRSVDIVFSSSRIPIASHHSSYSTQDGAGSRWNHSSTFTSCRSARLPVLPKMLPLLLPTRRCSLSYKRSWLLLRDEICSTPISGLERQPSALCQLPLAPRPLFLEGRLSTSLSRLLVVGSLLLPPPASTSSTRHRSRYRWSEN